MSTYTPIATQTLASAAASVTFSSIPQGYTDLVLLVSAKASAEAGCYIQFNGDTGTNYSDTYLAGSGSTASSGRVTSTAYGYIGNSSTNSFVNVVNIMNYSNSTTYKTFLSRGNYDAQVSAWVNLWRNSNAITSIDIKLTGSDTFNTGSTFSIYGIQVGDKAQKAQGGNIVTSDGTYVYHTFTSSGSFIPNEALTVDYLVVAGGGSGGGSSISGNGGGGGAGGYRTSIGGSPLSLTAQSYPVIIGAGGAQTIYAPNNGNNSTFASIVSTGGGGGGYVSAGVVFNVGNAGGSSGGNSSGNNSGGTASSPAGQGNAGGNGSGNIAPGYGSAGGGGAGAVGANGTSAGGGNGGNGLSNAISGSSVTYAGGGAGASNAATAATGGSGGGGNGAYSGGTISATAGTVNLGGGGGGGGSSGGNTSFSIGQAGGSGIVIVRYAI
jgi:hypothetical protein